MTRDQGQILNRAGQFLTVRYRIADAHVENDFLQLGHLHGVGKAKFFHEAGLISLSYKSFKRAWRAIIFPSLQRVARGFGKPFLHAIGVETETNPRGLIIESRIITLETLRGASFSMMPPVLAWLGLVWRLTIFAPPTITFACLGMTAGDFALACPYLCPP